MEKLKELLGEEIFKEHVEPKLEKDTKYFFGMGEFIPKGRFDENNTQLRSQLKERDDQLKELKKTAAGNEELTKRLEELTALNDKMKTDYENKLKDLEFKHAYESKKALINVKDPKLLDSLIDKEKLSFKDGVLLGFDEQIEPLKKSHDYLFIKETQPRIRTNVDVQSQLNASDKANMNRGPNKAWNRRNPYRT